MTKVSPVNGTGQAHPAGGSVVLKDQFLQLLVAQLRNQDPMRPMEDRDFIAQLAQFAVLEQLENLGQEFKQAQTTQQLAAAGGLIGRMVEAEVDGKVVSGRVSAVLVDMAGTVSLKVGDKTVPFGTVRKILSEEG
ncbi:MAG: flagellar hook capping protein [Chloroflexota bacterium]